MMPARVGSLVVLLLLQAFDGHSRRSHVDGDFPAAGMEVDSSVHQDEEKTPITVSFTQGFVEKVSSTTSHLHELAQGLSATATGGAIVMYGPLAGSLLVPFVAVPVVLCGCCAASAAKATP